MSIDSHKERTNKSRTVTSHFWHKEARFRFQKQAAFMYADEHSYIASKCLCVDDSKITFCDFRYMPQPLAQ